MAQAAIVPKDIPFLWEGKDKKGNRVSGKSLAASEQSLRVDLRRHKAEIYPPFTFTLERP